MEEKSRNRGRKTRKECVNDEMKVSAWVLQLEWDVFRFTRRGLGKTGKLENYRGKLEKSNPS